MRLFFLVLFLGCYSVVSFAQEFDLIEPEPSAIEIESEEGTDFYIDYLQSNPFNKKYSKVKVGRSETLLNVNDYKSKDDYYQVFNKPTSTFLNKFSQEVYELYPSAKGKKFKENFKGIVELAKQEFHKYIFDDSIYFEKNVLTLRTGLSGPIKLKISKVYINKNGFVDSIHKYVTTRKGITRLSNKTYFKYKKGKLRQKNTIVPSTFFEGNAKAISWSYNKKGNIINEIITEKRLRKKEIKTTIKKVVYTYNKQQNLMNISHYYNERFLFGKKIEYINNTVLVKELNTRFKDEERLKYTYTFN